MTLHNELFVANELRVVRDAVSSSFYFPWCNRQISGSPVLFDVVNHFKEPATLHFASTNLGIGKDVLDFLVESSIIVPARDLPFFKSLSCDAGQARAVERFLKAGNARESCVLIQVPCDFAEGEGIDRAAGSNDIRRALGTFIGAATDSMRPAAEIFDYEFGRIYRPDKNVVIDLGKVRYSGSSDGRSDMQERLSTILGKVLEDGGMPLLFGGDHSITFTALSACLAVFPELQVVHFDAHTDLYNSRFSSNELNHANVLERALEVLPLRKLVQIGVREFYFVPHGLKAFRDPRITAVSPLQLHQTSPLAHLDRKKPVYLTFDVDVMDPGIAPATGHPVPGGLSYLNVVKYIDELSREFLLVGADFVEVAGTRGANPTAAIVSNFISRIALNKMPFEDSIMNFRFR